MKKLFNVLGIIAASAIAFTACQEASVEAPVTPNLVTVTFTAQTPGTKLAATEGETAASYKWTDEDAANMRLYTVSGTTVTQVSNPTITLEGTDLNISATVAAGKYTFRAILASKWTGGGSPRLDKDQSPAANAFDPTAVIMFSDDKEVDVAAATDPIELTFTRKSIVNKMTLKGLAEGETIEKVVITSDKSVVGYLSKDTKEATLDNKVLTLSYKQAATVPASGQFDVYFTALAVADVTLTVDVTTDQNTYTKTFGGENKINFVEGQFTRFGVAMPAGTPIVPGPGPSTEDYSGTWALVGENTKDNVTSYYAARAFVSSNNNLKGSSVTYTAATDTYSSEDEDIIFTFTKIDSGDYAGSYTIQDANNLYLYASSGSSNQLKAASTIGGAQYYWDITKDGTKYTIIAKDTGKRNNLRFNYNNGSTIFACYAGDNTTGTLVTLIPASKFTASAPKCATPTFSPAAGAVDAGTKVSITSTTDGASIYYTIDGTAPTSASTLYASPVEVNAAITIKAIAIKDGYSNSEIATAAYTIKAGSQFTTVAELNALATSTETDVTGTLTNAVVSYVPNAGNAVIKDATGSVLLYKSSHGLKQGQTYSGELTVKLVLYQGYSEIKSINVSFTGDEAVVAPETLTLATLSGNFTKYQNAYVKVEALEVLSVSGQNINVKNGDNTYVVFSGAGEPTCSAGDVITVTGTVTKYSTTEEIKAWKASDIEITSGGGSSVDPGSSDIAEYYKFDGSAEKHGISTTNSNYTSFTWTANNALSGVSSGYPSSADWKMTAGNVQNNGAGDIWFGTNSGQKSQLKLNNGGFSEASAIATAIEVDNTATYYGAMICTTNFANICKIVISSEYEVGGGQASYVWVVKSTDNGSTYSVVKGFNKPAKAGGTILTVEIADADIASSASYALVFYRSGGQFQYKAPQITFYTKKSE